MQQREGKTLFLLIAPSGANDLNTDQLTKTIGHLLLLNKSQAQAILPAIF